MTFRLETERLLLRNWRAADAGPFHAMCSDPRVMAFLGPAKSSGEVEAAIARQQGFQRDHGHCFWAIERKEDGAFLGFCGLKPGPAATPLEGRVEIGWRLAVHAWGRGYAREGAEAALDWAFDRGIDSVWAMTVPANVRSWGLMARLGMERCADLDFDHPAVPADSPLLRHIVYAKRAPNL